MSKIRRIFANISNAIFYSGPKAVIMLLSLRKLAFGLFGFVFLSQINQWLAPHNGLFANKPFLAMKAAIDLSLGAFGLLALGLNSRRLAIYFTFIHTFYLCTLVYSLLIYNDFRIYMINYVTFLCISLWLTCRMVYDKMALGE